MSDSMMSKRESAERVDHELMVLLFEGCDAADCGGDQPGGWTHCGACMTKMASMQALVDAHEEGLAFCPANWL